MCGGAIKRALTSLLFMGLSPRVRGSHFTLGVPAEDARSIPACAGEPGEGSGQDQGCGVYPRVCGGASARSPPCLPSAGLSPRVRGSLRTDGHRRVLQGSIPACAGEPHPGTGEAVTVKVYPRVCGGAATKAMRSGRISGLSPRVRGSPPRPGRTPGRAGSIPACAGEPQRASLVGKHGQVYPRVCGGAYGRPPVPASIAGLSPRVRGSRNPPVGPSWPSRSIPACAGEPRPPQPRRERGRVYPRVCGGAGWFLLSICRRWGLSPRVRGSQPEPVGHSCTGGSIPACAGEPRQPTPGRINDGVYPRVCGGAMVHRQIAAAIEGLSPRVRGSHRRSIRGCRWTGSIPACAGEPQM